MSFIEILEKGGVTVYILALFSIVGISVAIYKYISFMRMGRVPKEDLKSSQTKGPERAVMKELFLKSGNGVKDLEDVRDRVISKELERLESGLKTISILASTAPLLGLLGTILGMIGAFQVIEESGGKVDSTALAGGIWEAMVTTGVGLSVALVLMFLLHQLEGIVEKRYRSMYHFASLTMEKIRG